MELTGRHLFIDTCIYDAKNYSFDINILDHISRLAQKKSIHLVSSEIVRQEVLSHVKNKCQTTLSALKKFHREAKILRNIEAEPYVSYFNVFNSDSACKDIERKMDDFFNITDTLFVDVNDVNPKSIIDDYFKSTPPFSEGNKKAEFPDAFILHSLSTWSQKTGNVVSVVSTDKDMKHFCEKSTILQYCEDLPTFIEHINKLDEGSFIKAIRDTVNYHNEEITKKVGEQFTRFGFWLKGQDGEVTDVQFESISESAFRILESNENDAIIEMNCTVNFIAEIEYDDLLNAPYDSEEGVLIPLRRIQRTVVRSVNIDAEVSFMYSKVDRV